MAIEAYSTSFGPLNKQYWGTAPPSVASGITFEVGDVMWNTARTTSGITGWECITRGDPGTWVALADGIITIEKELIASETDVARNAFVARETSYRVVGLSERHSVLGSTTLMLVKAVGSTPIASATPLLASTINLASPVDVANEATLIGSNALQTLAAGDALALRWGATNLGAVGTVQIRLVR